MIESSDPHRPSLEERLGVETYRKRRAIEAAPRRFSAKGGSWREQLFLRFPPYEWAGRILKWTRLWERGYRNFLDVQVVEVSVTLERLPVEFDGFRILQLSDIHLDLDPGLVPVIQERLTGLDYDLAVITGDFKNRLEVPPDEAIRQTLALLPSLRPPLYGTLGNHDTLAIVEPLEAAGLPFLLNESVTLRRAGAELAIGGVDDSYLLQTDDIPRAFEGIPPAVCKVLLSHAPTNFRPAAAAGVDYFICGHTHGGQIRWRSGGVVVPSGRVPAALISGAWQHERMQGYTNHGTGACHLPIRFNCPGEITIHTLRCPTQQPAKQ